jgi:hypothetical protein
MRDILLQLEWNLLDLEMYRFILEWFIRLGL